MLASTQTQWHINSVHAKSWATGISSPSESRRTSATIPAGAFFVPALNGGGVWEAFEPAGFLDSRSANPCTAIALRLAAEGDGSTNLGATMKILSRASRAKAHRRMAHAALHADSSLSTRIKRYNRHVMTARQLEARNDTR